MSTQPTIIDHIWIPMSDGARLGARLWLPFDLAGPPTPAVLEYIPYRKDDVTISRDATLHPHLAQHGYACIRVDMRGSGSSSGVLMDEYSEQEMSDGEEVLAWIAEQPWCDGRVGMIGISWGGITGLQMAARRAPSLKAVIALGSTDSRYYDDAGYFVGCMVGQTVGWAAIMLGYNTRPPDPLHCGDGWRDLWMQRLAEAPMYLGMWLEHQRDDAYWQRGSVSLDYAAIETPVYAVSGHADCWPNTVDRLLTNLPGPSRGLQGPWSHRYPQMAIPGPAIGFLHEVVRWFDHWLKETDTGIEADPTYRVYMQESVRPATFYEQRPGRWISEANWPSSQVSRRRLHLGDHVLSDHQPTPAAVSICSPQTVGLGGGEYMPWFAFGPGPELAEDQRRDDHGSLTFDLAPLSEPMEILGRATVRITVASNQPQALVAARLCDVWPDGASTLITRGVLNLSQRTSKSDPSALVVDEPTTATIELNHVAYAVPPGHRLRLSISTSYWPIAWPSPRPSTITIHTADSELHVPVRQPDAVDAAAPPFADLTNTDAAPIEILRDHKEHRSIETDPETNLTTLQIRTDNGRLKYTDTALELDSNSLQKYVIDGDDPLTARAHYEWRWEYQRGSWHVETTAETTMTCTETSFVVDAEIVAFESGTEVFRRVWNESYPRDHF